jgi:hypothetical protein
MKSARLLQMIAEKVLQYFVEKILRRIKKI